jgi:hypothetical protein
LGACATGVALACACGVGTGGLSGDAIEDDGGAAHAGQGANDASGVSSGGDATFPQRVPPPLGEAGAGDPRTGDSGLDAPLGASSDSGSQDCNTECMAQTCGGQQAACGVGSACEAYFACLIGCGGSDASLCSSDCESTHAAGAQASAALASCALLCGLECAAGSDDAGPD